MSDEQIKAIPSLVLMGNRQDITTLFIDIRQVDKTQKEKLLKAIAKTIYLHRAILSESSEGTILAFFNIPVRQHKHELEAIRAAMDIQKETKDLKLKIGFGINTARIISAPVKNNIINYTCLGDAINIAKKLSIRSENNILLSKSICDKISNNIKVEEDRQLTKDLGMPVYSLNRIIEREKYGDYIQKFLRRYKEDEKK